MKKRLLWGLAGAAILVCAGIMQARAYTPLLPPSGGGTGTSTTPLSGQTLIGNASGTYSVANLLGAGCITVATSSGGITLSCPAATATTTINGTQATVFQIIGDGTTVTSTVNGATTTFSIIITGNWAGTWQGVNSTTFYLASNPNGYITTSTNNFGGLTGNSTSSYFTYYNGLNTLAGSSTWTQSSFDTYLYADQFPGADMGAKINAAYAALPSSGGTIIVPAGFYSYATPIVFGTRYKQAILEGAGGGGFYTNGGTTLQYTSSTGIAFTYNVINFSSAGIGMFNLSLVGPAGVGNPGSSTTITNTTSTQGVHLGGTWGATGFHLDGVQISGFGKGVQLDNNTFITNIDNSAIQYNGMDIYEPGASNAFENNKVTNSLIADCNSGTGSIASNCVYLGSTVQSADWIFQGNDFDDAQINLAATGLANQVLHLAGNHFEDPNNAGTGCYDFVTSAAGQQANNTVYSSGNTYLFGGGTNCPEEVTNGGNFISSGDTLGAYSTNTTTTVKFVTNSDAADTFSWYGLNKTGLNGASQTVYMYASTTYSPQGFAVGSGNPQLWVTSSTFDVGIATTSYPAYIANSNPGGGLMALQNTSGAGYSSIDIWDASGTKIGGFGVGGQGVGAPYKGNFYIGTNASNQNIVFLPNNTEAMRLTGTGNVTVTNNLDASGTISQSGVPVSTLATTTPFTANSFAVISSSLALANSNLYFEPVSGQVDFGTSTVIANSTGTYLAVFNSGSSTMGSQILLEDSASATPTLGITTQDLVGRTLTIKGPSGGVAPSIIASSTSAAFSIGHGSTGQLNFVTSNVARLNIASSGVMAFNDVNGPMAGSSQFYFVGNMSISNVSAFARFAAPTGGLLVGGAVGIGTTSTAAGKVSVQQAVDTNAGGVAITNTAGTASTRIWMDATGNARIDGGGSAAGLVAINASGTGAMTTNSITASGSINVIGTSSTIKLGTGTSTPGCFELYDASNGTKNWMYDSSTAMVVTSTQPTFCQNL